MSNTSVFLYEPRYDSGRLSVEGSNPRSGILTQDDDVVNGVVKILRPRMDLHVNAEGNLVTATFEMPGLTKEDIAIEVNNGRLLLTTENKPPVEHAPSGYAIQERRFGKISRSLKLPPGIKAQEVKTSMEDGVLTVTFPRVST